MIISTDAEKAFDKIQHPFMKKKLSVIEENFLNLIKNIYKKTLQLTSCLIVRNLKLYCKIRVKARMSPSHCCF